MPMTERQYLIRRCLRLEAQIIALRRKLAEQRPNRRYVTDADRTRICDLHQHGKTARAIATETGWSINTVYGVINASIVRAFGRGDADDTRRSARLHWQRAIE